MVFSIHNCGIPVSCSTTVRVILAFRAGVFRKMSNFVQYFGEGTFLTMLVREGILRKFQFSVTCDQANYFAFSFTLCLFVAK